MESKPHPKTCWICGKVVKLEECKVDEHGHGVHESCYLAKVTLEKGRPASRPEA